MTGARDDEQPKTSPTDSPQAPRLAWSTAAGLLSPRRAAWVVLIFVVCIAAMWAVVKFFIATHVDFHGYMPSRFWPINVFNETLLPVTHGLVRCAAAAALWVVFWFGMKRWKGTPGSLATVLALGLALVLAGNLVQGYTDAFVSPVDWHADWNEPHVQYYQQIPNVQSTGEFLRDYVQLQPDLETHAQIHPPGCILLFYWLKQLMLGPAAISILIAIFSVAVSGFFFYRIAAEFWDESTARWTTFIYLLVPSVQIYYCATLDAVIASCAVAGLYFLLRKGAAAAILGAAAAVFCMSFMTFAAVFMWPVIGAFELFRRRRISRTIAMFALVAGAWALVWWLTGFNYYASYRKAMSINFPDGWMLLTRTNRYLITRPQDIIEILVFFGPFLILAGWFGLRILRATGSSWDAFWLTAFAALSLLGMFGSGACDQGETARACLFIYPFLMLPVGYWIQRQCTEPLDRVRLASLVFGQTLVMQAIACYVW